MIKSVTITDAGDKKLPYHHICDVPFLKKRIGKEIAFGKGLNFICGPNGSGKTTLLKLIATYLHCKNTGRQEITEHSISELVDSFSSNHQVKDGFQMEHDGSRTFYCSSGLYRGHINEGTLGMLIKQVFKKSSGEENASDFTIMMKMIQEALKNENKNENEDEVKVKHKHDDAKTPNIKEADENTVDDKEENASVSESASESEKIGARIKFRASRFRSSREFEREKRERRKSKTQTLTDGMVIDKLKSSMEYWTNECNDHWKEKADLSMYILKHPTMEKDRMTLIVDELDANLDISNQIAFLKILLEQVSPLIQVLVTSHSPLAFLIFDKEKHPEINVIETENGYYKKTRKMIRELS